MNRPWLWAYRASQHWFVLLPLIPFSLSWWMMGVDVAIVSVLLSAGIVVIGWAVVWAFRRLQGWLLAKAISEWERINRP